MAINIMEAFQQEPPQLDFIWPGFLAGTVGALVAPGATGKSFWALEAAMSIACSVAGGDVVNLKPQHTGRVVYLAGEDPEPALIRRIHAIGQHLNQPAREAIAENLTVQPIMGAMLNIMDERHRARVIEFCTGARLIVLDTLSRIHSLDENSNGDMARLVATLEHVAASTGASVLYLHHVSKGSAREGQTDQQQAARGASALIDNARWCGFVAKMTEDEAKRLSDRAYDRQPIGNDRRGFFVRFGVSKQNYDATPLDQWYERRDGGVLVPVELLEVPNGKKGAAVSKHDLTHARHDPAHCLAPGLFRSLKRGERKRGKLDVVYDYGDGKRIEFSGPEPLGADDLRILQGLVAMAGPGGLVLSPEPQTEAGQQLRLFLEPKWEAVQQDAMVVKGSYRALAREIGYANPDDTKPVRECIERLWKVSIIAQNGRKRQGFRLLSEYASDEQDGKLYVALNPLIARAVMGGAQHVRIDMDEVRALQTDPARLMYQRLCGWIDPGKSGRVELDTLCGYVWPGQATNPNTLKTRRQAARRALPELAALGWTVSEYAKNKFEIGRPKATHLLGPAPKTQEISHEK